MAIKPLTFTPEDVLLIRAGLAKRAMRRPADTSIASDFPSFQAQ
jgi:hypothetical protein